MKRFFAILASGLLLAGAGCATTDDHYGGSDTMEGPQRMNPDTGWGSSGTMDYGMPSSTPGGTRFPSGGIGNGP